MENETDRPEYSAEAAQTAHSATDRAATFAHDAIDRLAQRTARVEEQVRNMGQKTTDQSREVTTQVVDYVNQHPFMSLGAAALAGFILSSILRR